jgi:hypothetical protein
MAQAYIPAYGGPSAAAGPLGLDAPRASRSVALADPDAFPFIQVVAVKFESDHKKKMTDQDYAEPDAESEAKPASFDPGGSPFPEDWTWKEDPWTRVAKSHPVSHTGGSEVKLNVTVRMEGSWGSARGTLIGRARGAGVPVGMKFVAPSQTFHEGDNSVKVVSSKPLSKGIRKTQFKVSWQVVGSGIHSVPLPSTRPWFLAQIVQSQNEMFVTMGEPQFEDEQEITYGRMAHAVEKAGTAGSTDPHQIVEGMVKAVGFDGRFSGDTWLLARNPGSKADCITIAKYVAAIVKLVGLQGTTKAVVVYPRPKVPIAWEWMSPERPGKMRGFPAPSAVAKLRLLEDVKTGDFKFVEDPFPHDAGKAGLNWPAIFHRTEDRYLRLIDHNGGKNNYEGCVKFTDGKNQTKWYPAGTGLGGFGTLEELMPRVFKTLSWVGNDGSEEVIETY